MRSALIQVSCHFLAKSLYRRIGRSPNCWLAMHGIHNMHFTSSSKKSIHYEDTKMNVKNRHKHGPVKPSTDTPLSYCFDSKCFNIPQSRNMPPSNLKRPSRITIACNSCRSRKQKCSGGKPVCTQCLEHNRPCDWPEQLKRGPAKGYIEMLENRLYETETVLLKVLSQIPDSQLVPALSQDQSNSMTGGGSYSPFSRLGKRGAEYWNGFPLDTAKHVREWQHDCLSQGPTSTGGVLDRVQSESSMNIQHAKSQDSNQAGVGVDDHDPLELVPKTAPNEVSHAEMRAAHPEEASPPLHLQQRNASTSQPKKRKRSTEKETRSPYQLHSNTPDSSRHISQEPSSWTGAPPITFQEQFLW